MMTESVDLTIVIRKTNGQLTVSTLPKSNGLKDEAQNHIVPLTVTGTPQELDTGFLQAVTRPIQKACGLISNMAQFEAQADSSLPNLNIRRSLKFRTGRKNGSCRRTNSNRTSPIRNTPHTVRRTTRNTSISRSPCWNPSIHLIRQFKTWHSKLKE